MSAKVEDPEMKHVVCTICDIGCQFRAEAKNGQLSRILPHAAASDLPVPGPPLQG